jgi:hypothetical protein
LKAQISIIKAKAQSNLRKVQLRVEELQVQLATQEQTFSAELLTAKRIKKEVKIERDQLLGNIKLLKKDLRISQSTSATTINIQAQQSAQIEALKLALQAETVRVQNEMKLKLEAFKERLNKQSSMVGRELLG